MEKELREICETQSRQIQSMVRQCENQEAIIANLRRERDELWTDNRQIHVRIGELTKERDTALADNATLKGCVERLQARIDHPPIVKHDQITDQVREIRQLKGRCRNLEQEAASAGERYRNLKASGAGGPARREIERLRKRLDAYVPLLVACRKLQDAGSVANTTDVMRAYDIAVSRVPLDVDGATGMDHDRRGWFDRMAGRVLGAMNEALASEARAECDARKQELQRACKTIADMHEAAVGEVRGPIRGIVDDVRDLRDRMLALEAVPPAHHPEHLVRRVHKSLDDAMGTASVGIASAVTRAAALIKDQRAALAQRGPVEIVDKDGKTCISGLWRTVEGRAVVQVDKRYVEHGQLTYSPHVVEGAANRVEVKVSNPPPAEYDPAKPSVWPELIRYAEAHGWGSRMVELMKLRHQTGIARYGVPLQPFNGRKTKLDLLEELLDAAAYATQQDMERRAGGDSKSIQASLVKSHTVNDLLRLIAWVERT